MAGLFYPGTRGDLDSTIRNLLSEAIPPVGRIAAIVSPHGALSHSGRIQAMAWKAVSLSSPKRVVVIGPSHSGTDKGIFLPESGVFETPLGDLGVDLASCAGLADSSTDFHFYDIPHLGEHSIEVQLPFMQVVFPEATLVPVIVSHPDRGTLAGLSRALDAVFGASPRDTLFVVSSNMATDRDPAAARARSSEFASGARAAFAPEGDEGRFVDSCFRTGAPCGALALAALAYTRLLKGCRTSVLGSADTESLREGHEEPVVTYSAMAFSRE